MKKFFSTKSMKFCAFLAASAMAHGSSEALATAGGGVGGMVSSTGSNLTDFPRLISAVCYIGGAALVGTGVMKVKGHVDNPGQTPLREGLVRLGAGGCLVAAPALTETMRATLGASGSATYQNFGSFTF
jgi:hypothetical protein